MSTPRQPAPRAKREELKTYRELALGRELKSIRARRRVEAKGRERVIGDGSSSQPYLTVVAKRYREVRLEHQRRLLLEARGGQLALDPDRLLRQLAPRLEALVYAQLEAEVRLDQSRRLPVAALGRALTEAERTRFAESAPAAPAARSSAAAGALDRVLHQVEKRQVHNPARYQTVWAQLIGPELAAQSRLERIDPATQTAWFRCYNSVLSTDLQRRRGLPEKLGRALGLPVKRLRASF
jgi:hypothetical protein